MPTTLWIILGCIGALLLLLVLVLLLGMAKIRIAASGERLKLMLSLFGVGVWLLPTKKGKKSKLLKKFRDGQKQKKAEKQAKRAAGEPLPNLIENLEMIFVLLKLAQKKLDRKLQLRVHRFHIEVATPDAAQTALLYGTVVGVSATLWEWIQLNVADVIRKPGEMAVYPNYQKSLGSADIDITFKLRGIKALFLAFEMIDAYKEESAKTAKKVQARAEKAKARAAALEKQAAATEKDSLTGTRR